jgi:hypothetical protein
LAFKADLDGIEREIRKTVGRFSRRRLNESTGNQVISKRMGEESADEVEPGAERICCCKCAREN